MDEDTGGFDLDSQGGASYFPQGEGSSNPAPPAISSGTGSRRGSAAEQLAANTMANAGRRTSNAGSAGSSGGGSRPATAVGLDSVEMAAANSKRSDSRSPSFTLPSSRRSSSITADRSREGIREEMRNREDGMDGLQQDEEAFEEDAGSLDPEGEIQVSCRTISPSNNFVNLAAKAKQAAFAQKRNAHYGNEAEA
jgi:protein phosphatase inhibitor 2